MMRTIARKSVLFAICASMALALSAQTAKKEIGLQLWSVRDDMGKDAAGTIAQIGKMGYTFVEAASYNDGKFYGMEPAEFKALLDKNGLAFLSSHTGENVPDAASWDETMKWWDACIDAHLAAGVKYIVKPSMDQYGYGSLEDLKR
ncbi:MAG: sugar phosphate isomerase/epimerase, partial [Desulfobacterales bacterium]|nr:sugar phosphate isomerase/epimerase [Desulfobacterales bacterium]